MRVVSPCLARLRVSSQYNAAAIHPPAHVKPKAASLDLAGASLRVRRSGLG